MKYLFMSLFLITWAIVTLVATITVLGLLMLLHTDWFEFPQQLIRKI